MLSPSSDKGPPNASYTPLNACTSPRVKRAQLCASKLSPVAILAALGYVASSAWALHQAIKQETAHAHPTPPPKIGTPPGLPQTTLTRVQEGKYLGRVLSPDKRTCTDIEIRGAVFGLDPQTKEPTWVGGEVIIRTKSPGGAKTEWTSVEALLSNPGQATAAHSETDCSAAQLPDLPPLPK